MALLNLLLFALMTQSSVSSLKISLNPVVQPVKSRFLLQWGQSPSGETIEADGTSLFLNGKRVLWAMGEFHYARCPEKEWRSELLKMKAGGIDVVSSYVFWIHHEEIEGNWDWQGRKDLRHFLSLCKELGLKVLVRGGPWAHGECRNGGFPDWVVKRFKTRTSDPAYLSQVGDFYRHIAKQMSGLTWAEGGPVIGFQLENEFGGQGSYFRALKKLAIDEGIHVPLYTRTGWPKPTTPVSDSAIFPVYGGYPIGFWDRGTDETALKYGTGYLMTLQRNPDRILQGKAPKAKPDATELDYPYLCCEIGGGMAVSYHRRVVVNPDDIGSLGFVKLASGNNLQGYYMYHGGANPIGKLSTLNETQATGYWNDLPAYTYDFQAPIGEAGQLREHYHILRRMHLLMEDFGAQLAAMPPSLPENLPKSTADSQTLRWSVRSNGQSGLIFVNNYQRMQTMPPHSAVQFDLTLASESVSVPVKSVTIPANSYFCWPFNWDLFGANLRYALAQPICTVTDGRDHAVFFAEIPGIKPEFAFKTATTKFSSSSGEVLLQSDVSVVRSTPSLDQPAVVLTNAEGRKVKLFVISAVQSLRLWKGSLHGQERVVLTGAGVEFDRDGLVLTQSNPGEPNQGLAIYPPIKDLQVGGKKMHARLQGDFAHFDNVVPGIVCQSVEPLKVAPHGPLRMVSMGSQGVAEQPSDKDFVGAAIWNLTLPPSARKLKHPILKVEYVGDVARLYLDGQLISDNFYNGKPHEIDLSHYGPAIFDGKLELRVLPLGKDAPIYINPEAVPKFGTESSVCKVTAVSVYGYQTVVAKAP